MPMDFAGTSLSLRIIRPSPSQSKALPALGSRVAVAQQPRRINSTIISCSHAAVHALDPRGIPSAIAIREVISVTRRAWSNLLSRIASSTLSERCI